MRRAARGSSRGNIYCRMVSDSRATNRARQPCDSDRGLACPRREDCPWQRGRVWKRIFRQETILTPLAISAIAFVFIFGGALLGMWLRAVLPEARLSNDAKDVVRLSMGLIATISALVLGLLIASAKTAYDGKTTKLKEIAANVI